MFAKALYVSFQQTLRSVALTYFPSAFFSLIIWATAGSSSSNTSDPLRGSLWLWLSLHLEHFQLVFSTGQTGVLSYLPIGAALIPLASLRSGIKRLRLFGDANLLEITLFFLGYEGILLLAAYISRTHGITPELKYIPITSIPLFIIAGLTTFEKTPPLLQWVKAPLSILLAIAGVISIIYGVALFTHIQLVKSLAVVIQPGWVGGISLLLLQILYIPNLILAGISYTLGFGYTIGMHTHLTPTWFALDQLPSLQSFAALPSGTHPTILYSICGYVVIFALYQILLRKKNPQLLIRVKMIVLSTVIISILLLGLSYVAGGELLTSQLSPVGIKFWPIAASYAALSISLLLIVVLIPAGIYRNWKDHQTRKLAQVKYE
jgi:hypothetical protein